ncbi:MAG: heavy-metal-associated domain-containing protein, partial [Flavobacteriales bacterium]|nr:heavy-metal-associated domain-containing protein [Flavobacteriales bacterium]
MNAKSLLTICSLLLLLASCSAQMRNMRTATVHVNGDCGICEPRIEKAAFVKGEAEADWDVDAKTARITFDSVRTTLDAVLQRIAQAGYDSEKYLAPDAAYAALPGCCQYERTDKHAGVKSGGDDHAHHDATLHERGSDQAATDVAVEQAAPNPKTDQFKDLLDAYFALKNALVASDAVAAAASADAFT